MTPEAMFDKANEVRSRVRATRHVSLTELARGKTWREELPRYDVMEIIDHGSNAGWLVSDSGMDAMLDMISYLEERLEQASIAALVNARRGYDHWLEGDDLARAALESLPETAQRVHEALALENCDPMTPDDAPSHDSF